MKEKKTRKLVCNITGRALFAGKDYYNKKLKKAGTEERLHKEYICREALQYLKKGYSIDDTQHALNITNHKCTLTQSEVKDLIGKSGLQRLNTLDNTDKVGIIKTDPEVKKFINNILANE